MSTWRGPCLWPRLPHVTSYRPPTRTTVTVEEEKRCRVQTMLRAVRVSGSPEYQDGSPGCRTQDHRGWKGFDLMAAMACALWRLEHDLEAE